MIKNRLYLGNVNSEATEEEIITFIEKYCEGKVSKLTRVDLDSKDGAHSYIAEIVDHSENYLNHLNNTVVRLHDIWWKERHLFVNLI